MLEGHPTAAAEAQRSPTKGDLDAMEAMEAQQVDLQCEGLDVGNCRKMQGNVGKCRKM